MNKPTLLIIDDEEDIAGLCEQIARSIGFATSSCTNFNKNSSILDPENPPDVILMDLIMPETEGMELIQWLAQKQCTSKLIIMSGYGEKYLIPAQLYAESCGLNFNATIAKPFSIMDLKNVLEPLL
ncbi:MAG: response regulator [Gammaproteobacteria bacterium]|nr:response regulator [Gammaproteobacteria bacterium]